MTHDTIFENYNKNRGGGGGAEKKYLKYRLLISIRIIYFVSIIHDIGGTGSKRNAARVQTSRSIGARRSYERAVVKLRLRERETENRGRGISRKHPMQQHRLMPLALLNEGARMPHDFSHGGFRNGADVPLLPPLRAAATSPSLPYFSVYSPNAPLDVMFALNLGSKNKGVFRSKSHLVELRLLSVSP